MSDQDQPELTPRQRQRVDDVLAAAMEAPPSERDSLVVRQCGDDGRVLAEVLALLERVADDENETGDLLERPARVPNDVTTRAVTGSPSAALPDRIGRYEILRVVGRGGMGTVYEARQDSPRRRVALKIINPGVVSHELLRRFEVEAQILGRLQHPGIAQIFEAGTFDQGAGAQPFFAMEFVDGVPLVQYAREHELGNRERLELLAKVCDAVQHAHQRGVIHRDLKPGNILVVDDHGDGAQGAPAPVRPHPAAAPPPSPGGRGVASDPPPSREGAGGGRIKEGAPTDADAPHPKILDFGVARATDSDLQTSTLRTDIGQLIGTIPYMSPEQAAGDPDALDTRSDVYALGVIAYELLADRLPYDVQKKMIHEAVRVIREDDPTPLSSVNRTFRGDVEIIVGKALEKQKSRRYQSASDLAVDIRRYLTDEPILARPPSRSYQLTKFARRNRALISGVAAVFVVLVAGIVGTSLALLQAQANERDAQRNLIAARQAKDEEARQRFLAQQREQEARDARDAAEAARVQEARQRSIAEDNEERALTEAAKSEQIATFTTDMLSSVDPRIAGRLDKTLMRMILDGAAERVETELTGQPEVEAAVHSTIGVTYATIGEYSDARPHLDDALEIRRRVLGDDHLETIATISSMGTFLKGQGELEQSESLQREALDRARRVLGDDHPQTLAALSEWGSLLEAQGRFDEAEQALRAAADGFRRVHGDDRSETLNSMNSLGLLLLAQGELVEAESYLLPALDGRRRVLGDDHPATLVSVASMGTLRLEQGRLDEAEPYLREAMEGFRRILGDDHIDTLSSINQLSLLLLSKRRLSEAEPFLREALEGFRRVVGPDHPNTLTLINNMGQLLYSRGRRADAEPHYRESLEGCRRTLGDDHPKTLSSFNNLGSLLEELGQLDEAEQYQRMAMEGRRRTLGDEHPSTLTSINNLAFLLQKQGKQDEAERCWREALAGRRRVLGDDHPDTLNSINNMGYMFNVRGKWEQAEPYFREAVEGRRRLLGNEHPNTLTSINNLGAALMVQGRLGEAEPCFRELLDGLRPALGDQHQRTLTAMITLGAVLQTQGKSSEAEPYLREVMEGYRQVHGDDHWRAADAQSMLGEAIAAQGRWNEAEPVLLEAYQAIENSLPENRRADKLGRAIKRLVELYEAWDQPEKAAEWRARLDAESGEPVDRSGEESAGG